MEIHTDAIVFITMLGSMIVGFGFGRLERKDAYTKAYRLGFKVGKEVAKHESK